MSCFGLGSFKEQVVCEGGPKQGVKIVASHAVRNDKATDACPTYLMEICQVHTTRIVKERVKELAEERADIRLKVLLCRSFLKEIEIVVDVFFSRSEGDVG